MGWTTSEMVAAALGPSVTADPAWLDQCVDAANAWAPRKRVEAGYVDDPDVAPDAAAALGTTMYAVALYRERGAVDGYPSFEDLSSFAPTGGSMGQIKRLLGIGRGQVDAVPLEYVVNPLGRHRRHPRRLYR